MTSPRFVRLDYGVSTSIPRIPNGSRSPTDVIEHVMDSLIDSLPVPGLHTSHHYRKVIGINPEKFHKRQAGNSHRVMMPRLHRQTQPLPQLAEQFGHRGWLRAGHVVYPGDSGFSVLHYGKGVGYQNERGFISSRRHRRKRITGLPFP
jgi:hypothetical protein